MESFGKLYLTNNMSDTFDMSYRYQVKLIEYLYENKKGTPITILINLQQFSTSILFNPIVILKIIGKNLSCRTEFEKNNKRYCLYGHYKPQMINEIIYEFIRNYLLCKKCGKPEIDIKCGKYKINFRCRACGYTRNLNNDESIGTDLIHKNLV